MGRGDLSARHAGPSRMQEQTPVASFIVAPASALPRALLVHAGALQSLVYMNNGKPGPSVGLKTPHVHAGASRGQKQTPIAQTYLKDFNFTH